LSGDERVFNLPFERKIKWEQIIKSGKFESIQLAGCTKDDAKVEGPLRVR
jgi:hypothetical protein